MRASNFEVKYKNNNNNINNVYPHNERPIYLDQSVLFVSRHTFFNELTRPSRFGTLNIQAIICNDRCRVTFHFKIIDYDHLILLYAVRKNDANGKQCRNRNREMKTNQLFAQLVWMDKIVFKYKMQFKHTMISHERACHSKIVFRFYYLIWMIILSWPWRVSFIFCSRYSILLSTATATK